MREKVSAAAEVSPSPEKNSALIDSDATALFDATKLEIAHAAETPENSTLPAATDNEDHLVSLSHSILDTSVRSESKFAHFLFLKNLDISNKSTRGINIVINNLEVKWLLIILLAIKVLSFT